MEEQKKLTIGIAGASGFIGRNLIEYLLQTTDYNIVGFCRDSKGQRWSERLSWRSCDLYSLLDADAALIDVDVAIYLVHSMIPTAQLSQGNFRDFDLIMADNFSRAARKRGVKKIIYLSGIIPATNNLSNHLASRLEVEKTLQASEIPTTVFRCGLILGPYGSSFEMMVKLVKRLPLMVCPAWTKSECQPVDLIDLVEVISKNLAFSTEAKIVNVVGPESYPYVELLKKTSKVLKRKITFINVPYVSPKLSTLWVSLISRAPISLVRPLVSSLKHNMNDANSVPVDETIVTNTEFEDSLKRSFSYFKKKRLNKHERIYRPVLESEEVRSVQRFILPSGKDAAWVASEYMTWLPKFLSFLVFRVKSTDEFISFNLFGVRLLVLKFSPDRSSTSRQLFYIAGGVLADYSGRGRLEFRESSDKKYIIAAIHEFRPNLPWYIYRYTQAIFHLLVMRAFGRHLWKVNKTSQI
tara:strand:- start:2066 stop:3466 length:1401 start_codon:yes stop_codon:yes gene_type:complete